jgi:hypothetical protein
VTVDTTVETTSLTASNDNAQEITVTVEADEQLSDLSASDGDGNSVSGVGADGFSETSNDDGSYTYEATYDAGADGDYTVTLDSASDTNDNSNSSTGLSDSVTVDTTGSFSGTVTDSESNTLDAVDVTFTDAGGDVFSETVTTNTDGTYTVEDIKAGTYDITASADGYEEETVAGVEITATEDTSGTDFTLAESPQFDTAFVADENPNQIVVDFDQAVVLDDEVDTSDASAHFTFNPDEDLTNGDVSVSTDELSASNGEIIVPLDGEVDAEDADPLTNALTYDATDEAIVDDDGGTTSADGFTDEDVSNNVAGPAASVENLEADQDFVGIVLDEDNELTVTADVFDADGTPVNGDVSIQIVNNSETLYDAGTATVSNGDLSTTITPESIDESTVDTGTAEIEVAGVATTEIDLVHEVFDLNEGYTVGSVPQPAELHAENIDGATQWDAEAGSYSTDQIDPDGDFSDPTDLHRGLYVHGENDDARLGYDFETDNDQLQPGQITLQDGGSWNLVSSNFDISAQSNEEILNDLTIDGAEGHFIIDGEQSDVITAGDTIGAYDAYWIQTENPEFQERGTIVPEYDPEDRADVLSP